MGKHIASFQHRVNTALPNGDIRAALVTVEINEYGKFEMTLPEYVNEALAHGPMVVADSLDGVIGQYEASCESYSVWRTGKRPIPMLALSMVLEPRLWARDELGIQRLLGIGLIEVSVESLSEGTPIYRRHENPELFGERLVNLEGRDYVLLPEIPKVRAKYEELAASIQTAADLLGKMSEALDPTAYFLAISHSSKPAEPVAAADPATTDPAEGNPAQAELPLNQPNDDEEL